MSPLSIHPLHEPGATEPLLDVIFVHGLGGDAIETWHPAKRPDALWPKWLAEDHSEMAVWTLDYPAKATKWSGQGNGMALPDRGKQVLDYLVASGFGRRPIAFVAHSLGGLLVKQVLRASIGLGVPQYRIIGEKTRGVIFLATPHAGSDLSGLAQGLSFFSRPTEEVQDLRANNPYLLDLADWYRNQAPMLDISTYAYRENRPLAGNMWVVEPASADPGIAGALCIAQDEDHFTIAKPADRQHPVYVGVQSTLAALVQLERERKKLTLELGNVVLTVAPQAPLAPTAPSAITGGGELFRDLERSFQFKLPSGKGWAKPQWISQWDLVRRTGLDEDTVEQAKLGLTLIPLGKMLGESESLCLFYGNPIVAKFREDSTTKPLEVYLKRLQKVAEDEGTPLDDDQIQEIRQGVLRQQLPMDEFIVQNSFIVNTMRKELAADSAMPANLPNLFMLINRSVPAPIDNLVANELSILWGSTVTLRNMEVAGETRELTANTMTLLAESRDYFYQVTIYYSPQTENPLMVWSQLQEMAQSFAVLGT